MMVPVVNEALKRLWAEGIREKYELTHDMERMKQLGIQYTPAMTIDGKVVIDGKYPGVDGMVKLIRNKLKEGRPDEVLSES